MRLRIPKLFNLKDTANILPQRLNPFKNDCNKGDPEGVLKTSSSAYDREMKDMGNAPYIFDIEEAAKKNNSKRAAVWTGKHFQLVLMSIPERSETGVEMHDDTDQFIRIEEGSAEISMGRLPNNMTQRKTVDASFAVIVPAGTYHNIKNTGGCPLKLYTIYAPPHHPFGIDEK